MPDYAGFDISIAGVSYKLMRNSVGALALRFLSSADEPGQVGQVGTIAFNNLHHGLGPALSIEPDRYVSSGGYSALRPGRIEAFGNNSDADLLVDGAAPLGVSVIGSVNNRIQATSFQHGTDIYFVLPQKVIKFTNGALTGTTVVTLPGTQYFRGPGAFYRGRWYFGLQDSTGKAIGHALMTDTGSWFANDQAQHTKASLFFSVHTALWALEVVTASATVLGEVDWLVKRSDAQDPSLESAWGDLTTEKSQPFPTAIHPLARWLMVFGADGEIDAVSADGGAPVSITPSGAHPAKDYLFGVGAKMWGDLLLVPSQERGLMALSLSGTPLRDIQPINVNGGLGLSALATGAIGAYGADMLVGAYEATFNKSCVLALRHYPEGVFYQMLYGGSSTTGINLSKSAVLAIQVTSGGRAYVLLRNASNARIRVLDLPPQEGGRPLTVSVEPAGFKRFNTSYTFGPSMGKKLFLQARAWIESALTNSQWSIETSYDNGAVGAMAAGQAAGMLVGSGNRGLGRSVQVSLQLTGTAPGGLEWPVLLLPIFIDYMDEPEAGNRLSFDIDARGGFVRAGMASSPRLAIFNTLKAMEQTAQTVTLLESGTAYTAIIEQVESEDNYGPTGRERPSSVVKVAVRILA